MADGRPVRETPHGETSYAGFPLSGTNGYGLWCPVCGLPLEAVVHGKEGVGGLHHLWRDRNGIAILDTWWCTLQGVR